MNGTVTAASLLLMTSAPAPAQTLSAEDLSRHVVERRAFEAVVWGMPIVN